MKTVVSKGELGIRNEGRGAPDKHEDCEISHPAVCQTKAEGEGTCAQAEGYAGTREPGADSRQGLEVPLRLENCSNLAI